jgi:branched-chain amino acid aminotransferase
MTRQTVLELAAELGVPAETGDYPAEDLRNADEAFITSTAGGVMPIARVDDRHLSSNSPGSVSIRLREEYWRRREAGWLSTAVDDPLKKRFSLQSKS